MATLSDIITQADTGLIKPLNYVKGYETVEATEEVTDVEETVQPTAE